MIKAVGTKERDRYIARLKDVRERLNLTQEEFAAQLSVSRRSIAKWETGEAFPAARHRRRIEDMFGITLAKPVRAKTPA
jgi:transcriptional regulator with XRE-family HTH domain